MLVPCRISLNLVRKQHEVPVWSEELGVLVELHLSNPSSGCKLAAPTPVLVFGTAEREALRVLSDEVIRKKDKGSGACINLNGDVSKGKGN